MERSWQKCAIIIIIIIGQKEHCSNTFDEVYREFHTGSVVPQVKKQGLPFRLRRVRKKECGRWDNIGIDALNFLTSSHFTFSLGLPGVPYFTGRPVFGDLCPASRKERLRDSSCPVFKLFLSQVSKSLTTCSNSFTFGFIDKTVTILFGFQKLGAPNRAEPESRTKPKKERRRSLGRGLSVPSPENVWNFELQIVQSGV